MNPRLARGIYADNIANGDRVAPYDGADVAKMRAMGFTYVAIPVDPDHLQDPAAVARLDAALAMFHAGGFALSLLLAPALSTYALGVIKSQSAITTAAQTLAARYAPLYGPQDLFFDILDEPHYNQTEWNAFAPGLLAVYRASAPFHTLIVQPGHGGHPDQFATFTPLNDLNIVYAFHVYVPAPLVVQGQGAPVNPAYLFPAPPGVPGSSGMKSYAWLAAYIQQGIDWGAAHKLPVIMNAFGCSDKADRQSRINWTRFVRETCERTGLGWAWWSWDSRHNGIRHHLKEVPTQGLYDLDLVQLLSTGAPHV